MISERSLSYGPSAQMGEDRVLNRKSLHPANAVVTTSIINFSDIFAVYALDLTAKGAKYTKSKHKRRVVFFVRRNASAEGSLFFRSCPIYRAVLKI